MKKNLFIILLSIILLQPNYIFAQQQIPAELPTINGQVGEPVVIPMEEIRNQDFLVPTSQGVKQGNLKEAQIIQNLETQSLEQLSDTYLLGDYDSGQILLSHNIDKVVALASTSKLVGIYVIMDKLKSGEISYEDQVIIDAESAAMGGSSYDLKENDIYTVKELLDSAVIVSANDSITALGKYIAGTKEAFVGLMQEKCNSLGLTNAYIVNATGLTNYEIDDFNKMTTRELFELSRNLVKDHPSILNMSTVPYMTIKTDNRLSYNTNPLLGIVPQVNGLKTGYTGAAGRCLVATALKTTVPEVSEELKLIGITMGSSGDWPRFVASKRLMTQGLENYSKKIIANPDIAVGQLNLEGAAPQVTDLYPKESSSILLEQTQNLTHNIVLAEATLPIEADTPVGTITYYVDAEEVFTTELVTKEKVKEENLIYKFQKLYMNIFENIKKAA